MSSRAALAFLVGAVWPGRKRIAVWLTALYWSILPTTCSTVVKRVSRWSAISTSTRPPTRLKFASAPARPFNIADHLLNRGQAGVGLGRGLLRHLSLIAGVDGV